MRSSFRVAALVLIVACNSAEGPPGAAGATGATGAMGAQGSQGPPGPALSGPVLRWADATGTTIDGIYAWSLPSAGGAGFIDGNGSVWQLDLNTLVISEVLPVPRGWTTADCSGPVSYAFGRFDAIPPPRVVMRWGSTFLVRSDDSTLGASTSIGSMDFGGGCSSPSSPTGHLIPEADTTVVTAPTLTFTAPAHPINSAM